MPAGVIVAGGRSARFGEQDKALAPIAGVPMIRRVADRLAPVLTQLVVNCRSDQREGIERALGGSEIPTKFAEDDDPDRGPTAGIRRGLGDLDDGTLAFVVACDMPLVDPEFVSYLFERAAGRDGAIPRTDDGWYQTTHAVYRAGPMASACETALARGDRRVVAAFADLDYAVVSERDVHRHAALGPAVFENVNTEADLESLIARFS